MGWLTRMLTKNLEHRVLITPGSWSKEKMLRNTEPKVVSRLPRIEILSDMVTRLRD